MAVSKETADLLAKQKQMSIDNSALTDMSIENLKEQTKNQAKLSIAETQAKTSKGAFDSLKNNA